MPNHPPLLEVRDLTIEFPFGKRWTAVVSDAQLTLAKGDTVGLVGESGSGKSVTSMAVLGLIGELGGRVTRGSIHFDGNDVVKARPGLLHQLRGDRIGMIFQQPGRSLNPAFTVGDHIAETVRRHRNVSRAEAWKKAVSLLDRVGIARAGERASDYPHQFSGGMCQRVMIAMAISCEPQLLIADEPTTALDVTVQAKVLELLNELIRESGMAMLFISHDLTVVSEVTRRVVVMYAGETVESGPTSQVFSTPQHPYTRGLIASIPGGGRQQRLKLIQGGIPSPAAVIPGCRFHPRCDSRVSDLCNTQAMALREIGNGRSSRCLRAGTASAS
ncbi:ABC transporter ATP-binding protein [Mesorhizobium sp. IMUNJ 23232]|uniref:ABC transporter ATP-binding protein n=1 Tax=Mesorhizobium sp. IMUNJ 23232 TaxID=3376064 RepID=UPI00379B9F91